MIGNIITPHGRVNEKKSKVFPAMMFDMIRAAVNTPVNAAYNSVFVKFSNMIILYFQR
jgi:hypothetical protein